MAELVFVYGSLRRGGTHASLLKTAEYLGAHCTEPQYTLHDLGDYPAAVEQGCSALTGEVYAVESPLLAILDDFEEYPQVYTRQLISTPWGDAWIYLMPSVPDDAVAIAGGDWLARAGSVSI